MIGELRARGSSDALVRVYAEAAPGGPPPDALAAVEAEARRRPHFNQFESRYFL